jgi:hypothetical protein
VELSKRGVEMGSEGRVKVGLPIYFLFQVMLYIWILLPMKRKIN